MNRPFSNKDLYPIAEAYQQMICENAEGKNINKAEAYIKHNYEYIIGKKLEDGTVIDSPRKLTEIIRNSIPNVRLAKCKFLLGVTRIYFDDINTENNAQRMIYNLNQYLKIISSDAHVNEYDNNLNNLSYYQIEDRFSTSAKSDLSNDKNKLKNRQYTKNERYRFVKIGSFKEAEYYGRYTTWCVTHSKNMFESYTNGGIGVFYFCLRDGFENEKPIKTEGCPMDEYGKSMIAISVNEDGSLNTCTCRWNHDNGGNDTMMDTEGISDFFGVNFYDLFKPRSLDEIWELYLSKSDGYDEISTALGARRISDGYGNISYVKKDEENGIINTFKTVDYYDDDFVSIVFARDMDKRMYTLVSGDKLYWFDKFGRVVNIPEHVVGNIQIRDNDLLTSLEGMPTTLDGTISLSGCSKLSSLDGCPISLKTIYIWDCERICNLKGIGSVEDTVDVFNCKRFNSLEGLINVRLKSLSISDCQSLESIEYCPKIVSFELRVNNCKNLKSLNHAPLSIGNTPSFTDTGIEKYKILNYKEFVDEFDRKLPREKFDEVEAIMEDIKGKRFNVTLADLIGEDGRYKEIC